MNEEFSTPKKDKNLDHSTKSKKGRVNKNANKKKKNNSAEDKSPSPVEEKSKEDKKNFENIDNKNEKFGKSSSEEKVYCSIPCSTTNSRENNTEAILIKPLEGTNLENSEKIETTSSNKLSESSDDFRPISENINSNLIPTNNNNSSTNSNINRDYNSKRDININLNPCSINNSNKNSKNFKNVKNYKTKTPINKYVTINDDNEGKMSWRKGMGLNSQLGTLSNTQGVNCINVVNPVNGVNSLHNVSQLIKNETRSSTQCDGSCSKAKKNKELKFSENKEEAYVNNFVKNLLSQIVTNEVGANKGSQETKSPYNDCENEISETAIKGCSCVKEEKLIRGREIDASCTAFVGNNNSSFVKNSPKDSQFIKGVKIGANEQNVNLNISKPESIKNKKQSIAVQKGENLNSNDGKENFVAKKKNSKPLISPINKEYVNNYGSNEIDKKEEKFESGANSLLHNSRNSKFYNSDNECKIETINHEIIQNTNNSPKVSTSNNNNNNSNLPRVMVDNFSQTDLKKEKFSQQETADNQGNLTLSETIHSSTHDEEEKSKDIHNDNEENRKDVNNTTSTSLQKNHKKTNKETDNQSTATLTINPPFKQTNEKPKIFEIKSNSSTTTAHKSNKNELLGLRKGASEGNKPLANIMNNSIPKNKPTMKKEIFNNESQSCLNPVNVTLTSNPRNPNTNNLKKGNFQTRYHNSHNVNMNVDNEDEFSLENENEGRHTYPYKKYNKGYYSSFYNKRNKYYPYAFNNCNKFNNMDTGYMYTGNKEINNRPLYSRNFMDFSPHFNNFSNFNQMVPNSPMFNYGSQNIGGKLPEESPMMKESSIYNNYYIINSNVNISNINNNGVIDKIENGTTSVSISTKSDSSENYFNIKDSNINSNVIEYNKINKKDIDTPNANNHSDQSSLIANNYLKSNDQIKKSVISPITPRTGIFPTIGGLNPGNPLNQVNQFSPFTQFPMYYPGKGESNEDNHNSQISQNPNNNPNILNKIGNEIYPFIFHYRLHNDILDYSSRVTQAISYLKDIKLYIINFLEKKIKESLQENFMIDLYGSFATDLSIESSDIDITIKFENEKTETQIKENIEKLCVSFNNLKLFETVTPITSASVPVIKILINPLKVLEEDSEEMNIYNKLKNIDIFTNYKFDVDELLKVKVDLTFIQLNQSSKNYNIHQSTKNSLEWAKKALSIHPEIKPIIHVLKRYLQIKKLNSSFNGKKIYFLFFRRIILFFFIPCNHCLLKIS